MPAEPPRLLSVRHRGWATPPRRPRMSNQEDVHPGVALTNRALLRGGAPVIPVSGELHYSRVPRHRWRQRLRQMRAGGVTVAATYAFWLHHVERRGQPRFDGNLDVAAFVDLCAAEGLDVVLRIGPWCHGETRNGGFPDWVQQAPVRHRTDDPAYLALVREWFGQLGRQLGGRPVLGIQLENELYDQPGHLVTLKGLARAAGLSAPLWTATAWGSADLPAEEVLPLYGGYGDGFWVEADAPWDPTFRDHYFFSHVWDDPGIGADLRRQPVASRPRTPSELFPPATCELGGGMATAYHRRPRPAALDIAAIAHCKIGNGSAWQGYYMYAGGTNPPGADGMQESHATGYPNDLPRLGYDFHAPIGEAGVLAASHCLLRQQHAFLAAFGTELTEMPSSLPAVLPAGVEDTRTLRWALRSDGVSGFLFIAWHQPHVPLSPYRGARFEVALDGAALVLPSRPVDVPAGTLARWPLRLTLGGVRLDWVTASALTVLPGVVPTLVATASAGVPVEYALDGVAHAVTPSREPVRIVPPATSDSAPAVVPAAGPGSVSAAGPGSVSAAGLGSASAGVPESASDSPAAGLDLLVLPAADAGLGWVCEDGPAGRRLLLSSAELAWGPSGQISSTGPDVLVYDPERRGFVPLELTSTLDGETSTSGEFGAAPVDGGGKLSDPSAVIAPHPLTGWGRAAAESTGLAAVAVERDGGRAVPVSYGKFDGRESAPGPEVFEDLAAVYRVELPEWAADPALDAVLHIGWAGDVGQLRVDGRPVTDRFWDGSEWIVNLRDAGYRAGARVSLHLLPLAAGSPVWLPAEARERLLGSDGQLLALDYVRVDGCPRWRERTA